MSLKILLLSHKFYPDIGGIEANSEVLADAFSEEGHKVKVLTWSEDNTGKKFPYEIVRNPGIGTIIAEQKWADVVFENNPCLRLSWPAFFLNKPTVIALNTWVSRIDGKTGIQDKLKFKWFKRAKDVIAVSDAIREKCWKESIVIGNPYNNTLFRELPGVDKDKTFVFLGRLVSDKGADQAVLALNELIKADQSDSKKYHLTFIGDGPERGSLEELVNKLQLTNHVTFKGALRGENLVTALNEHRFILIPSMWEEPFGNVALEGMACGCIPIASDGGGLPTAVGKAGLIFKRGDLNDFVKTINRLLNNPELEKQLRIEAINHLQNHQPKVVASQYLEVIQKAAKSN